MSDRCRNCAGPHHHRERPTIRDTDENITETSATGSLTSHNLNLSLSHAAFYWCIPQGWFRCGALSGRLSDTNWKDALRPFDSIAAGLQRTDLTAKEWIGMLAYWMLGRSSALFSGSMARACPRQLGTATQLVCCYEIKICFTGKRAESAVECSSASDTDMQCTRLSLK